MPRAVMWYCDPAGARERIELTAAGRKVRPGINDLRLGLMAVRSRIETGRLRVVDGTCPNLLYEAGLYRYDDATNGRGSETPLSESNHALDALRYLISRLDQRRMAKDRRPAPPAQLSSALPIRTEFAGNYVRPGAHAASPYGVTTFAFKCQRKSPG